jgi:hypothetical protein
MHYDVVKVVPLGPLRLAVSFADGLQGEVELRESHLTGVFAALKNPKRFLEVSCSEGFVSWPDEIDLAPDAMYDEIRAKGRWVLE